MQNIWEKRIGLVRPVVQPAQRLLATPFVQRIFGALVISLLSIGCGQSGVERITITGSSTIAPLVSELARRYEAQNKIKIDVQTGGSSRGISDVRNRLADIGMVSRGLAVDEQDLQAYAIAWDGVGIIVHTSNPVSNLTKKQIRGIYTGAIKNWSQVGGPNRPVTVVNKAEGRATLDIFLKYTGLQNQQIQAAVIIGDNEHGIKTVAGNPACIAYVSIGAAEHAMKAGEDIRLIRLAGVIADSANVANGKFPMSRSLNFVLNGKARPEVREFISYVLSKDASSLIVKNSFIPLTK